MMLKIANEIDGQSMRELRLMLITYAQHIEVVYPNPSPEYTQRMENLTHLVNELGLDVEGLLY